MPCVKADIVVNNYVAGLPAASSIIYADMELPQQLTKGVGKRAVRHRSQDTKDNFQ